MIEASFILALVVATAVLTVQFYMTEGKYNSILNYGMPIMGVVLVLFGKKMSEPGLLVTALCMLWLVYLVVTNAFGMCHTLNQFHQIFRRRYILVFVYIFLLQTVVRIANTGNRADVIYATILAILIICFWYMQAYPPGYVRPYQTSLKIQAALWALLAAFAASNHLYDISSSGITWRVVQDNTLKITAINSFCDHLIANYAAGFFLSCLYLFLVLIYHNLASEKCRKAMVHTYMILLVLGCLPHIPIIKNALPSIPVVGKYATSSALLLIALGISLFTVFGSLVKTDS